MPASNNEPSTESSSSSPINLNPSKLATTLTACSIAGIITYPAERMRISFITDALKAWDFFATQVHLKKKEKNTYWRSVPFMKKFLMGGESLHHPNYGNVKSNTQFTKFQSMIFPTSLSSSSSQSFYLSIPTQQKIKVVTSPFFRLVSHEIANVIACSLLETYTFNHPHEEISQWKKEIIAGSISGLCQALLFCPLEYQKAYTLYSMEEYNMNGGSSSSSASAVNSTSSTSRKGIGFVGNNSNGSSHTSNTTRLKAWINWTKSQLWEGGTSDPAERLKRAYRGIGIMAVREIIFNVTFFPLFFGCKRHMDEYIAMDDEYHHLKPNNGGFNGLSLSSSASIDEVHSSTFFSSISMKKSPKEAVTLLASGILTSTFCSLAVIPLDIYKTFYLYSRERWSVWNGRTIVAPPWNVLVHGLSRQAFVLGPCLGIVAAVYEMA